MAAGAARALLVQGWTLQQSGRLREALAAYDEGLRLAPHDAELHYGRGCAFFLMADYKEAYACYSRALAGMPHLGALVQRGTLLFALRRFEEAGHDFERALAIDPRVPNLGGDLFECHINACDWRAYGSHREAIRAEICADHRVARPTTAILAGASSAEQLQCSRLFANIAQRSERPLCDGAPYSHERIRVAYLSPEMESNPVATHIAAVIENHDRARFETIFVPFGNDASGDMRARIERAFQHVLDLRELSDSDAAQRLRAMEIDILVDLAGHTGSSRTGVLAQRPAPVQVNFLGFPATMGAPYIDYIVADAIALPFSEQTYYAERIVHLPDTLIPNDARRAIAARPTRAQAGLPENAFVFCCFNNSWKFTPEFFRIWMRLLSEIPDAVLWLPQANEAALRNLTREAAASGVAPDRLVFAPFAPSAADHLARLGLADLFLDTLPYNAHATACDALWAGLPVLTCKGDALAGRVAASLLHAIGVPELVTESLDDYAAAALRFAHDRDGFSALRARLAASRATCPLFDTARFTRNLERAFLAMWERHEAGRSPEPFAVASA